MFLLTVVKKKVQTRFGDIELSNAHCFNNFPHGFCISPFLQELSVFAGTLDVYKKVPEVIEHFLGIKVSCSTGYRLTTYYGEAASEIVYSSSPALEVDANSVVYAEMDGGMVFTDDGWQETKVGRVFRAEDMEDSTVESRGGTIKQSEYTAHLGNCHEFTEKMQLTTDKYAALGCLLVFIVDGATWMKNWIAYRYPQAIQILDFYHAIEHLAEFATGVISDSKQRTIWIETQKMCLLSGQLDAVIATIKNFKELSQTQQQQQDKLINYYQNNRARMAYHTFLEKGLIIGSGAIESAHRTVIQKRMKLSGQRWSNKGADKIINLRVAYMSNKWNNVVKLIKYPKNKVAA